MDDHPHSYDDDDDDDEDDEDDDDDDDDDDDLLTVQYTRSISIVQPIKPHSNPF